MKKDWIVRVLFGFVLAMGITMLILLCLMAGGCSRKVYLPVETVRTEFRDRINTERVTDSVTNDRLVYINGDTLIVYRWRDRWRTETKHDSIYIEKRDTVSIPYPVEKKLTKWQQAKMDVGGIAMGTLAVVICVAIVWLIKKFRK